MNHEPPGDSQADIQAPRGGFQAGTVPAYGRVACRAWGVVKFLIWGAVIYTALVLGLGLR